MWIGRVRADTDTYYLKVQKKLKMIKYWELSLPTRQPDLTRRWGEVREGATDRQRDRQTEKQQERGSRSQRESKL